MFWILHRFESKKDTDSFQQKPGLHFGSHRLVLENWIAGFRDQKTCRLSTDQWMPFLDYQAGLRDFAWLRIVFLGLSYSGDNPFLSTESSRGISRGSPCDSKGYDIWKPPPAATRPYSTCSHFCQMWSPNESGRSGVWSASNHNELNWDPWYMWMQKKRPNHGRFGIMIHIKDSSNFHRPFLICYFTILVVFLPSLCHFPGQGFETTIIL